jgi:hypothetical protein
MCDDGEPFTQAELEEIVNKLAWRGVEAEAEVERAHGIDRDDIPRLMQIHGYGWDSDHDVWASTREVWSG